MGIQGQNLFMREGHDIRHQLVDQCEIRAVELPLKDSVFTIASSYGREELAITPLFTKNIFSENVDKNNERTHAASKDLCKKIKATRASKKVVGFVAEFFTYGCLGIIGSCSLFDPKIETANIIPFVGVVLSVLALPVTLLASSIFMVGRIIYYASQHSIVTYNDKKYFVRDDRYQAFLRDIFRDDESLKLIKQKKFKHFNQVENACLQIAKQKLTVRVNSLDPLPDEWNDELNQELQETLLKDTPDFLHIYELILCGANPHTLLYRGDLSRNFEIGTLANFVNQWKIELAIDPSLATLSEMLDRRLPDTAKSNDMPIKQDISNEDYEGFILDFVPDFGQCSNNSQAYLEMFRNAIVKKPNLSGEENFPGERMAWGLYLGNQRCVEETINTLSDYLDSFPNSTISGLENLEVKTYKILTYNEFVEKHLSGN